MERFKGTINPEEGQQDTAQASSELDGAVFLDHYFGKEAAIALSRRPEFVVPEGLNELSVLRRGSLQTSEKLREERNNMSARLSDPNFRNSQEGMRARERMLTIRSEINTYESQLREIEEQLNVKVLSIPNPPNDRVPYGKDSSENVVIYEAGPKRDYDFDPKSYVKLAKQANFFESERGSKISESRFPILYGAAAELENAMTIFFLQQHKKKGFRLVSPPHLVNRKALIGTGQIPKFEDDMYQTTDGLFLIPTAEVPLTNLHSDEILNAEQLPLRYCAFTRCFRREVGAAGKDTQGWKRVHDFGKVEMMSYCHPDKSWDELKHITTSSENVLKALGLHYRRIAICTGDLGFANGFTFDLELFLPSTEEWLEVSSCSNYMNFQARRANIKFKRTPTSKAEYLHTLNGSGFPLGRMLIGIIEQCQQRDGSIIVPEVLQKYVDFSKINPGGTTE